VCPYRSYCVGPGFFAGTELVTESVDSDHDESLADSNDGVSESDDCTASDERKNSYCCGKTKHTYTRTWHSDEKKHNDMTRQDQSWLAATRSLVEVHDSSRARMDMIKSGYTGITISPLRRPLSLAVQPVALSNTGITVSPLTVRPTQHTVQSCNSKRKLFSYCPNAGPPSQPIFTPHNTLSSTGCNKKPRLEPPHPQVRYSLYSRLWIYTLHCFLTRICRAWVCVDSRIRFRITDV
jgi:hypothetical protein